MMQTEKILGLVLIALASVSGAAFAAPLSDDAELAGTEVWQEALVDRLFHISTKDAAVETALALDGERMAELVVELIGHTEPSINVYNAYRIGVIYGAPLETSP